MFNDIRSIYTSLSKCKWKLLDGFSHYSHNSPKETSRSDQANSNVSLLWQMHFLIHFLAATNIYNGNPWDSSHVIREWKILAAASWRCLSLSSDIANDSSDIFTFWTCKLASSFHTEIFQYGSFLIYITLGNMHPSCFSLAFPHLLPHTAYTIKKHRKSLVFIQHVPLPSKER